MTVSVTAAAVPPSSALAPIRARINLGR
jgi:hypothetical protein